MSDGIPPVTYGLHPRPCPSCGESIAQDANFCESCGAQLGDVTEADAQAAPAVVRPGTLPISLPTSMLTESGTPAARRECTECGGTVGPDLYCEQCGTKAPSEREHFRETPASWVAGVCDRGVKRTRNEDALAVIASETPGERCVLIVLDGVSSSTDSDVASLAGARAARDRLATHIPRGLGTPESRESAVHQAITDAVEAAQAAIVAHTESVSENPASATFTCVVLEAEPEGPVAWHANLGDSRCYWFPDAGEAVQLTRDDSAAEALIDAGATPEQAYGSQQSHAITRWLGRDSDNTVPTIGRLAITEDGWLLACSDGLWNYAREASVLAAQLRIAVLASSGEPERVALALVQWASDQGGHDNITVALARVGEPVVGEDGEPAGVPSGDATTHDATADDMTASKE